MRKKYPQYLSFLAAGLFLVLSPRPASAAVCNGQGQFLYCAEGSASGVANCGELPECQVQNDVVQVKLTLGAGTLPAGANLTVSKLHFELDCQNTAIPC